MIFKVVNFCVVDNGVEVRFDVDASSNIDDVSGSNVPDVNVASVNVVTINAVADGVIVVDVEIVFSKIESMFARMSGSKIIFAPSNENLKLSFL